jgi:hypothetical protein
MIRAGIFCLFFLLLLNPTPGFSNSLIDETAPETRLKVSPSAME